MSFLTQYTVFLAKCLTFVGLFFMLLYVVRCAKGTSGEDKKGTLKVRLLNEDIEHTKQQLERAILEKKQLKKIRNERKRVKKQEQSTNERVKRRVFYLSFVGDMKASAVRSLRREVTAILTCAKAHDEVIINLESHGGLVNAYGLAASQLQRLRDKALKLTVIIDKIAASGGYMMACIGERILAAPFAVVGSIGVVAQLPNFNRYLKKRNIDIELFTAGKYKRTLTLFGKNTDKGRDKFSEDLQSTHDLFKELVQKARPQLDIEQVATGETWYGKKAIEYGLVDEIKTSDEYLLETAQEANIYAICYEHKKKLPERFGSCVQEALSMFMLKFLTEIKQIRFFS